MICGLVDGIWHLVPWDTLSSLWLWNLFRFYPHHWGKGEGGGKDKHALNLSTMLWSCMDVWVGLWRRLSTEELMLLNCGVGEDSWESLGLQGDPTSPFWRRSAPGISFEGMMLKLQLQSFGHFTRRVDSLEKTDAGRGWGQEEKGTTEDEMAGWYHWLDGRESEWTPGVGDGQGGLACCDSWGHKESDMTEWLN